MGRGCVWWVLIQPGITPICKHQAAILAFAYIEIACENHDIRSHAFILTLEIAQTLHALQLLVPPQAVVVLNL